MKLGILKTGEPPADLIGRFGGYPDMFKRLLGADAYDYEVFAVDEGLWPETPTACDAWLVTGSSAGAYDPLPWIAQLEDFLRAALGQRPLVGICFGHQIMAQALGGAVIKSPSGWGVGEQTYDILRPEPWMDGAERIRLPGSHQDQVIEAPPGTDVIAASAFTPIGGLAWRDAPAISLQLHPEFEPAYAIALIESRRGTRFTDAEADRAIASYGGPDDRARVGSWIKNFLLAAT